MKQQESYKQILPYVSYDPREGIFLLKDASIGIMWKIKQFDVETADDAQLVMLSSMLCSFLQGIPEKLHAQFLLFISRNAEEFPQDQTGNPLANFLKRSYMQNLSKPSLYSARRIDVYFTIKLHTKVHKPGIIYSLFVKSNKNLLDSFLKQYRRYKEKLLMIATNIEHIFSRLNMPFWRIDYTEFQKIISQFIGNYFSEPISFEPESGFININEQNFSVLTLIHLPPLTYPAILSGEDSQGQSILDVCDDALIALNLYRYSEQEAQDYLRLKKKLAYWQLGSGIENKEEVALNKKEIDQALVEMYSEGYVLFNARIHIIPRSLSRSELDRKIQAIKVTASRRQLDFIKEDYYALTLFFHSLPFGFDQSSDGFLKRGKKMLSVNLADVLPVYGRFCAQKGKDFVFLNRAGQITTFSFFASNIAPHGIIVGVSGSGKSFLTNFLITQALSNGERVFVIDRGNSYQKISHLFGGGYFVADPDSPKTINPLYGAYSNELNIFATGFIAEAVSQGKRAISVVEQNLIANAVKDAFDKKRRLFTYNKDDEVERILSSRRYFKLKGGKGFIFKSRGGSPADYVSNKMWKVFKVKDGVQLTGRDVVALSACDGYKIIAAGNQSEVALVNAGACFTNLYFRQVQDLAEFIKICTDGFYPIGKGATTDLENFYNSHKGKLVLQEEVFLSDVGKHLASHHLAQGRELATCLYQFTGEGPYAKFFDGHNQIFFDDTEISVFELGNIALYPEISTCLLLSILQNIGNYCMDFPQRRKYLFIDEAWTLLRSDNTAVFIENAFRTYRKYGASCVVITQQPHDLLNSKSGMAILANAPNRIFLRLSQESLNQIADVFSFNKTRREKLASLRTIKGEYSEAMVETDWGCGVIRLVPDPVSYWAYTSDPAENARFWGKVEEILKEPGCQDIAYEDAIMKALSILSGVDTYEAQ